VSSLDHDEAGSPLPRAKPPMPRAAHGSGAVFGPGTLGPSSIAQASGATDHTDTETRIEVGPTRVRRRRSTPIKDIRGLRGTPSSDREDAWRRFTGAEVVAGEVLVDLGGARGSIPV